MVTPPLQWLERILVWGCLVDQIYKWNRFYSRPAKIYLSNFHILFSRLNLASSTCIISDRFTRIQFILNSSYSVDLLNRENIINKTYLPLVFESPSGSNLNIILNDYPIPMIGYSPWITFKIINICRMKKIKSVNLVNSNFTR